MSLTTMPDGTIAAMYKLQSNGDGRYYFEAFGFKSLPFELKDMGHNKEMFSKTIHGVVEGPVQ